MAEDDLLDPAEIEALLKAAGGGPTSAPGDSADVAPAPAPLGAGPPHPRRTRRGDLNES